eukprot:gene11111-biopygen9316
MRNQMYNGSWAAMVSVPPLPARAASLRPRPAGSEGTDTTMVEAIRFTIFPSLCGGAAAVKSRPRHRAGEGAAKRQ